MKHRPDFPDLFGSVEDARDFCAVFYRWHNYDHRHSGDREAHSLRVHHGHASHVQPTRTRTYAYAAHLERFAGKHLEPPTLPTASWINRPEPEN